MKKIYKVTNWNGASCTAENVANKTNWMVKALDECLTALDIGTFTFEYNSKSSGRYIVLNTTEYGTFNIYLPPSTEGVNSSSYVFYVNSEDKELFGCCCDLNVATYTTISGTVYSNAIRGIRRGTSTYNYVALWGGYLALKFTNGEIIGTSEDSITTKYEKNIPVPSWNSVGVILPDRFESLALPLEPIKIRRHKAPIYRKFYLGSDSDDTCSRFFGEYFNGIYVTDKYYVGALRTADNKVFVYNGYAFDVDDANDIGIIETTV